ncbi:polysaccharide biosynthesis tyrosine autokinase [Caulobacter sp. 17J80-11]|uniref:GumC family protein n=1 Tax=Caulobacter sp. 17J80-11 TaxID=2763502 RepID=UPI001653E1AE|nr:polysaccharide biosynthesis tyrosine autokinase [Caulobacter sp. 17J80-11]MBC6980484.1 polysaccharide biosynthesis tyrosine autokinase [Caulobacter sp. 17J80-11]
MSGDDTNEGEYGALRRFQSIDGGRTGLPTVRESSALLQWTPVAEEAGANAFNIGEYWRLLVKHRVVIGATFAVCLALGAAATMLMTPVYTATTTLQIDRQAAKVTEDDDTSPRDSMVAGEEFFQTQYGLLRSRSLSLRVIDSLGLAGSDKFLKQMGITPPKPEPGKRPPNRREQVLRLVQANLGVNPVRGSRLVSVTFDSPDAQLSARVANAFAENFIQSNLDRRFESSSYAREFLEQRLAQVKAKLEESERQLVAYAAQQQIIETGDHAGAAQSLDTNNLLALNSALAAAKTERVRAEERWREAKSAPLMSLPEVLQSQTVQQLSQERARLTAEYEQKLRVFKPDFPEMRQLKAQIDEVNRQIQAEAGNIRASIQAQYTIAMNQEASLQQQVAGLKSDVLDLRDRSIQYNILQREVDTSRTLYEGLLQRYKEIGVAGGITTNNISVVDRADPPLGPSKPNLMLNMMLAAVLGLGLGVLAAFVIEALDETLATPDDAEQKLGVPILGSIPLLEKGVTPPEALADIRSGFAEAYYSLRTALQFSTPDGIPRSLLVTSTRPGEGKSTTSLAVALNLARLGQRVLLIDADLRNPSMHRSLGADNSRGLSNVLAGVSTLGEVVQSTGASALSFVACGPRPPNPAELLAGSRVRAFLEEAQARYDVVVMDGPPIAGLADGPVLASMVGGTIFVLESRGTRRGQARNALARLHMSRARLLGALLTKFDPRIASYDYAYDYDYGVDAKKRAQA